MQVKETDLFKQISLLMLDRNKAHFDDLKEKLSMHANAKLDNSGMVRGIIEFLYEHQELLPPIASYVVQYKGFVLLESFLRMIRQNRTPQEIESELGVSVDHYEQLQKKYGKDLTAVKETDLFKKYSLLLLDRNKNHFDKLKTSLSKQTNMRLDNSVVVRAFVEFLYDHQDWLPKIAPYCIKYKGYTLLEEFMRMINENRTPKEIEDELGVSVVHIKELEKQYSGQFD